jgi:hypothetical protein
MCLELASSSSCLQQARENLREKEKAARQLPPLQKQRKLMDLNAVIMKSQIQLRAAKML